MTGQSPVNYFNSLRIGKAKSMFQQYGNSRTVKEIAYSCGFSDALYFSRVFRQLEGISTAVYPHSEEGDDTGGYQAGENGYTRGIFK